MSGLNSLDKYVSSSIDSAPFPFSDTYLVKLPAVTSPAVITPKQPRSQVILFSDDYF